ncbi:MAG: cob(I)yrinic acid a,c-diamide adenosyltransferase [Desulfurococcales archaeon]|nr:cob(I)yrinic acid a,c-diamide adenosyltransferase [Desulfurococcales archaeon]
MPRIYTRTGDSGETFCIALGSRVPKDHPLISFLGDLDEANSFVGLARSMLKDGPQDTLDRDLAWIQSLLFRVGYTVTGFASVSEKDVEYLERMIDRYMEGVKLNIFILPYGDPVASATHVARSVVRRAERSLVAAIRKGLEVNKRELLLKVVNRLSDALFAIAVKRSLEKGLLEEAPRARPMG